MKKFLASILTLALCLGLATGCAGKQTPAENDTESAGETGVKEIPSLKIAFSPYADADQITTATEPLEQLLQAKLLEKGYDVKDIDMTVGTSYTAVGEALSAGSADIGFISGGNYVLFSDDCDVLLTALRYAINKDSENPADWNDGTIEENTKDMSTYYRCIILAGPSEKGQELQAKVNAGEELTWDDLNSATWSVLSPTSASGYIYPCLWLQDHYGKGISDLEHVVQSDSHTTSVARLAAGQVDVMVSFGHIRIKNAPKWETELGGTAPMVEQTGVIGVTEGIYNDMIAYSKNSDTMADEDFRKALGESFIEIADTDEGREIISVFSQVGYTWGQDSDYDGAERLFMLLEVQHVRKEFQNRTLALTDASFSVSQGDFVSVIGPSGAGKTTLFRILNGSLRCDGGAILVNGVHFESADRRTRRAIQTTIGTIYQDFALVENATCRQNVLNACLPDMAFLPAVCGFFGKERVAEADALLDRVGLADKVHEPVKSLSGGQKQKIALARALVHDKPIIIFDEATSNTDAYSEQQINGLLDTRLKDKTVIVITHKKEILSKVDQIVVLKEGVVADLGRYDDLIGKSDELNVMLEKAE